MSAGIISAKGRIWGKAIQTDAKVSPSNYGGPLVDLSGRTLGILVPLSPDSQDALAGADWYDAGIGFAVPLADLLQQLPALRQGRDLHAGVLGVSFQGTDVHSDPALVGACHPLSPASKAGIRSGDRIVQVNGQDIQRQAQLKHALGPLYAGQTVQLAVVRGEQRLDMAIELTDKLQPYRFPFLGVLPLRDDPAQELGVRYVYPASPAHEAGIQAGDVLTSLAGQDVADAPSCRQLLAQHQPGDQLAVTVRRGQETAQYTVTLGELPTEIPAALPAAHAPHEPAGDRPSVGEIDMKLPEEPNACLAYVPDSYDRSVPHGVVIWLDAPGTLEKQPLIDMWKEHCRQHELILLCPHPPIPAAGSRPKSSWCARCLTS